jgi:DNA-binding NtrC family response regulator
MTDMGVVNARRIMIVTDDDVVRDSVEIGLADAGHTIRFTAGAHDALRWLGDGPWDLLIVDFKLPEMDGAQLYRRMLARCPTGRPRVLFVSGYDCSGYETDPEVLAVPLLFKPFTVGELSTAVQRTLETSEPCRISIGTRTPLS